ncbi:MAG: Holliday junction resolvase Hjc [archaeon GB-1867-035]|nr:Holliday junction resolvase Hjc [Candidatus Culexmicrobium profundum]
MAFRRGYRAEIELVMKLRENGFYAVRLPISGGRGFPCDVLAAKGDDKRAYQVKETKNDRIYLNKSEIEGLLEFSKAFGFKAYVAVKWKRRRQKKWTIIRADKLSSLKIEYG